MDTRIVVRLTEEEKNDLLEIANDLGLNLSDYVRKRILGTGLQQEYINFIKKEVEDCPEGEIFTIKDLLGKRHWNYMSNLEKKSLVTNFISLIEEEEIDVDVFKITKKGKIKFIKSDNLEYIQGIFNSFIHMKNSED